MGVLAEGPVSSISTDSRFGTLVGTNKETTTIWSRGPKSGDFPHVLQVHPQSGVTERVSGRFLCVAPLPHHLGG